LNFLDLMHDDNDAGRGCDARSSDDSHRAGAGIARAKGISRQNCGFMRRTRLRGRMRHAALC